MCFAISHSQHLLDLDSWLVNARFLGARVLHKWSSDWAKTSSSLYGVVRIGQLGSLLWITLLWGQIPRRSRIVALNEVIVVNGIFQPLRKNTVLCVGNPFDLESTE